MIRNLQAILFLAVVFSLCSCANEKTENLIYERLQKCNSGNGDSTVLSGKFSVFENRQTNSGRTIDLNIVVIPAIRKNHSSAPIFCFEGGPGVSATTGASFYSDSVNYYRINHDVVLIDVRGTGESNPLHCRQLQFKKNLEQQLSEMYPMTDVKDCFDSLSRIADLTQYTTTNMAMDIEDARKWLGYDKIKIFGLSFGGRLAQAYMKMFPNSVESCVLWSPATTSLRMPLYHAQYAEESLNKLFEDCKSDSLCNATFPELKTEFYKLAERGKAKNSIYQFKSKEGDSKAVSIPWFAFHTKIRSLMYSPAGLRQIPFIIHQSFQNNWEPFVSLYPTESSYDDFIAEGLYLSVTCSEDVPYFTKQESDSLAAGTFMGDYRVQQQVNACNNWKRGNVPDDFFEPVTSSIPTLIFSGYFDPVTPPSLASQVVKTLSSGFIISIPTMSHTFDGLANPECFDKLVIDFFNNPKNAPDSQCIETMLPGDYKTM